MYDASTHGLQAAHQAAKGAPRAARQDDAAEVRYRSSRSTTSPRQTWRLVGGEDLPVLPPPPLLAPGAPASQPITSILLLKKCFICLSCAQVRRLIEGEGGRSLVKACYRMEEGQRTLLMLAAIEVGHGACHISAG